MDSWKCVKWYFIVRSSLWVSRHSWRPQSPQDYCQGKIGSLGFQKKEQQACWLRDQGRRGDEQEVVPRARLRCSDWSDVPHPSSTWTDAAALLWICVWFLWRACAAMEG